MKTKTKLLLAPLLITSLCACVDKKEEKKFDEMPTNLEAVETLGQVGLRFKEELMKTFSKVSRFVNKEVDTDYAVPSEENPFETFTKTTDETDTRFYDGGVSRTETSKTREKKTENLELIEKDKTIIFQKEFPKNKSTVTYIEKRQKDGFETGSFFAGYYGGGEKYSLFRSAIYNVIENMQILLGRNGECFVYSDLTTNNEDEKTVDGKKVRFIEKKTSKLYFDFGKKDDIRFKGYRSEITTQVNNFEEELLKGGFFTINKTTSEGWVEYSEKPDKIEVPYFDHLDQKIITASDIAVTSGTATLENNGDIKDFVPKDVLELPEYDNGRKADNNAQYTFKFLLEMKPGHCYQPSYTLSTNRTTEGSDGKLCTSTIGKKLKGFYSELKGVSKDMALHKSKEGDYLLGLKEGAEETIALIETTLQVDRKSATEEISIIDQRIEKFI